MAKLICPHCGAFTAFTPAFVVGKGVLSEYSGEDKTRYGDVEISAIVPHTYVYGKERYAIVVCRGCNEVFVAKGEKYSDPNSPDYWAAVYPIQHKTAPAEIPEPIKSEFEEASLCFAIGAYKACVLMCQIVLEHVWQEQQASGLAQLEANGVISSRLYRRANEIRLWGNLEKHQLAIEPVLPEDAEQLLGYLEILLNEAYVEPKHLDTLTKKREELEKKD
jgi:hypothetical protein